MSPSKATTINITKDVEKKVCEIQDTSYCFNYLHSIPHLAEIDLRQLCDIFLHSTSRKFNQSYNVVHKLVNQTSNKKLKSLKYKKLKSRYLLCEEHYGWIKDRVNYAIEASKVGDYYGVSSGVNSAFVMTMGCFIKFKTPPKMSPKLLDEIQELKKLYQIIDNTAFLLR
ncbi:hypothetical protein M5689_010727 [Euphorbia peplus]|nr:hypothetical protein M5689_010727 [Euphorbia peplus]